MKDKNPKKKKSSFGIRLGQFIYLSFTCFNRNILWESASSCSYGFICSFVPIIFIITVIILSVVQISPGIISYIQDFVSDIAPMFDFSRIMNTVLNRHVLSAMDIVLGFWIIWMARKLSLSIIRGMNRIFGAESKHKNWWNQVLTFISEFALIIMVAVLILISFIIKNALNLPFFEGFIARFPRLISTGSNVIAQVLMYFIIFLCTVFSYKYLSGVLPPFRKCLFYAFLNTVVFYGLVKAFDFMVNRANYNLVFGTISSIIILIVKIYFFFVLFLLFAQMIYVSEYFDQLLKSQIYFLPQEQDISFAQSFIRMLFINPSILKNEENTLYYSANDVIFNPGDKVDQVFYLHKGIIAEEYDDGKITYLEAGSLLGTTLCIINGEHSTKATALTNCEMVSFTSEEFMQIIEKDPRAATKAVTNVHELTKELHYQRILSEMSEESN